MFAERQPTDQPASSETISNINVIAMTPPSSPVPSRSLSNQSSSSLEPTPVMKKKVYLKIFGVFLIVGALTTLVALQLRFSLIGKLAHWINHSNLGWLGWLAYLGMCIVASVCLIPQTPIEAAGGIIWGESENGLWKALVAAYVGKQVSRAIKQSPRTACD